MKKIGIVGGVAWPSTVLYYSELCQRSEQWHLASNPRGVPSTPEISIESLDLAKAVSYLGSDGVEGSWVQFDNYHRAALQRLEKTPERLYVLDPADQESRKAVTKIVEAKPLTGFRPI